MTYGKGITENVVSSRLLNKQMYFGSPNELAKYMRDLGYEKHPDRINICGDNHNLWYKGVYKNKAVRLFKESL